MRIINKDELKHDAKLINELKKSIFVYPTDTIYGIGCDATNEELVKKIREIKRNPTHPFSIIIPNGRLVALSSVVIEPFKGQTTFSVSGSEIP